MNVLFCADPLNPRRVDEAYRDEAEAARAAGLDVCMVDYEALLSGSPDGAVARVPAADAPTQSVYRGWMLTVEQYEALFEALAGRGVTLINTPAQYAHCHWLPLSYAAMADVTPKTVWRAKDEFAVSDLAALLQPFGDAPMIVKDYVKSRKHEWAEACFIPAASDTDTAVRVVETFLRRQGDALAGGLVFREFEVFEPLLAHPQSGMPLTREYRLIFLDGELLLSSRYWDSADYAGETPPLKFFTEVARRINSRFFTLDAAKTTQGAWRVIELGDAQAAELPPDTRRDEFYAELKRRV